MAGLELGVTGALFAGVAAGGYLMKMLDDNVIGNVLRAEEDPEAAVARLVFFANAKGGNGQHQRGSGACRSS